MNNTTNAQIDLHLEKFDFDTRVMEMIHSQFSGERTNFIRNIDELLRCWGMASAANPNIEFTYTLQATTSLGKAQERAQGFSNDHVILSFETLEEDQGIGSGVIEVSLLDPKEVIKLYDAAFKHIRESGNLGIIASFFSLREVFARIAPQATYVKACEQTLVVVFRDGEQGYVVAVTADAFGDLMAAADAVNDASLDKTLDTATVTE